LTLDLRRAPEAMMEGESAIPNYESKKQE
jgi:hypothetical protein